MGLQLTITSDRTLSIRGTKKIVHKVPCVSVTTYNYTIHIQMQASGCLAPKLPVILYEPSGIPKRFKEDMSQYANLHVYWNKSGLMGKEIAKQWMNEVFLPLVEKDSLLIIDAWKGYEEMKQLVEIQEKNLKIVVLPAGSSSVLQPADVYFNRPFKDFLRKLCGKIRWRHNDFDLSVRNNFLQILDFTYNQCKAPKYENFLKYSWFRSGYFSEHPPQFDTPAQYCLGFKGYTQCEVHECTNFCFSRCSYCEWHLCFYHALEHRHNATP